MEFFELFQQVTAKKTSNHTAQAELPVLSI
jgi:hypothetical protein